MSTEAGFNNIRQWLVPQLEAKGLSIENFSRAINRSRAVVYNYLIDKNRPDSQTMAAICQFLGRPLEEGLAQYTPRTVGRPKGLGRNRAK